MIYNDAIKIFPNSTNEKYMLYVRFSHRVNAEQLARSLNRKIKDFGSDRYNTLSMTFFYKNRCKNFMLEMKRLLKKDNDIREVIIRRV